MRVPKQRQSTAVVLVSSNLQVLQRFFVVLLETFNAEKIPLPHCGGNSGVPSLGHLHVQMHFRMRCLPVVLLRQIQSNQLNSLGHAHRVDLRNLLRYFHVVERCCAAGLGDTVALHMPVSHCHERPGVTRGRSCIQIQDTQCLVLNKCSIILKKTGMQNPHVVLRVGIPELRSLVDKLKPLGQVARDSRARQIAFAKCVETTSLHRTPLKNVESLLETVLFRQQDTMIESRTLHLNVFRRQLHRCIVFNCILTADPPEHHLQKRLRCPGAKKHRNSSNYKC
mmetsp:Transcript_10763/g.25710  ORF Transcript_10763/g.25710 Transcript_10763/m.25710 type:complete len:281 (+) Transcript_10763:1275-2117(+)